MEGLLFGRFDIRALLTLGKELIVDLDRNLRLRCIVGLMRSMCLLLITKRELVGGCICS